MNSIFTRTNRIISFFSKNGIKFYKWFLISKYEDGILVKLTKEGDNGKIVKNAFNSLSAWIRYNLNIIIQVLQTMYIK